MVRGTECSFQTHICSTTYTTNFTIQPFVTQSLGDLCDSGTPGHISNPVVKAVSADGTWGATPWESRSLPRDFFLYLAEAMFINMVFILISHFPDIENALLLRSDCLSRWYLRGGDSLGEQVVAKRLFSFNPRIVLF